MSEPKDYLKMTTEELAQETEALDAGAIPPAAPLTGEERARWEKACRGGSVSVHIGPGRPKIGEGATPVPVSVEGGLLRRALAKATALKLKRSEYFAKALQLLTDGEAEVGGRKVRAVAEGEGKPRKHRAAMRRPSGA